MDYQPLKYIYKASGTPEAYTLLLLHGTGGNEHDLIGLGAEFGSHINLLSVRGNVLEHGMPRFFKRLGMGVFDEQDLRFRTEELLTFIREISAKEAFDSTKVIALGYSNGANIAGALLVTHPDALAGAILFRPMPPYKELPSFTSADHVPLFVSSGQMDPTVDPESIQQYVAALTTGGFSVHHVTLPAGHNLSQQDLDLAKKWFENEFK